MDNPTEMVTSSVAETPIKKNPSVAEEISNTPMISENTEIVNFNAESLIAQAISQNVPVESLERLLAMRKELKAEWAKEQYNRAMANFQNQCPTIVKTKGVKTKSGQEAYKYAPIESIVQQVKPYLALNGFSYSTNMEVLPAGVKVICKVTHIAGHTEQSEMEVPLGTKTDIMSASQVTAAASTFAKRYAFCNAFGILTGDEDNDGQDTGKFTNKPAMKATDKQKAYIKSLMIQKGYTLDSLADDGITKDTPASEVIEFLIAAKSKVGPTGDTFGEPDFIPSATSGTPYDPIGERIDF